MFHDFLSALFINPGGLALIPFLSLLSWACLFSSLTTRQIRTSDASSIWTPKACRMRQLEDLAFNLAEPLILSDGANLHYNETLSKQYAGLSLKTKWQNYHNSHKVCSNPLLDPTSSTHV